ncbi:hypothetical protein BBJ28_00003446 [Nothophytophthora sp. Chile5]|nr:hypothetical protein BBJ28_00003446 [Nothophytophthora sp. Chile5]
MFCFINWSCSSPASVLFYLCIPHGSHSQLVFAAVGCLFSTGEYVSALVRQKEDHINAGVGGLLVGIVPGMIKQNMRVAAAASVGAGAAMCAASFWYAANHTERYLSYWEMQKRSNSFVVSRQSSQQTPFEKYAAARHADRS